MVILAKTEALPKAIRRFEGQVLVLCTLIRLPLLRYYTFLTERYVSRS